ncbi:secreted antigen 1 [Babesia divergens]|uniref:Secreted antigen 1 n=1 Tax=Babesia divergens TaxID=32595 RepID=A0AAD9GBG7_BABDI|nr:secreted antigen 1 [Babesia divergens]
MSVVACTSFPQPESLKDILELLHKIGESVQAKKNVGQKLLKDVETYCKDAEKFYKDSSSHSGFLSTVFTKAKEIRGSILQNSRTFEKYSSLDSGHGKHNDCIAEALKKCLPKAYAALYYLYFMGSQDLKSSIQGGKWDSGTNKCNASGTMFNKWLTDDQYDVKMKGLISRGFSGVKSSLTSNTAENVAEQIKQSLGHESPGPLQNVLVFLLFVCPWHDSLLGHAICFLSTFCLKVQDDRENFQNYFSSSDFEAFKSVCRALKSHLEPFTHASGLPLYAVCQSNGTLYSALWNPEAIPLYVKWLQGNLKHIIESLNLMSSEASSKWDSGNLQTADTAGPFRFGFVFNGSWTSSSTFKSKLPSKISPLTASLQNLLADLLFVFPWDPSLLGHALCFLYKFCSKVQDGSLEEKLKGYSGDLKTVCSTLKSQLDPFIFGSSYLFAVCKSNTTLFDGIWDDNKFDKYCEWLRKHLKNIIEALKAMSSDCKQWTKENLQSASSAGPFKYGFVFTDDSWDDQTFKSGLSTYTSPLTASAENSGSLNELEKALEPSSSTAAAAAGAAGGLFGLGGAGAGAAYGLNLFGFKNLVTGLISSFLK